MTTAAQPPIIAPQRAVRRAARRDHRHRRRAAATPTTTPSSRRGTSPIEVRPDAVVAARTAQDVVEAVRFAGEHGLVVTPQATGHGAISALVGQLLVNTAGLDECVVHPEGWARVGAGVKWLRVVEAAAPYGLAPLSGSITDVGIVGYTTGGGLGPMARTYGLASDRVRAIEVVTGDGELRRATPTEHPDLFFGLRGGKGALGIVTAIEFDLVHQPTLLRRLAVVRRRARRHRRSSGGGTGSPSCPRRRPRRSRCSSCPTMPGVPPQLAGRLTLSVRYVWTGDAAEGARWFAADARGRAGAARRRRATSPTPQSTPCTPTRWTRCRRSEAADGAHRLPGRGGRRAAGGWPVPGRRRRRSSSRSGRWAGRPRGRASTTARSAPATRRTRCCSSASPACPGVEEHAESVLDALAPVDRRAPAAELHLRRRGVALRLRRLDPRPAAPRRPHLRPAGVMMKDALVRLRQRSLSSFDGLWKWRRRSPISRVIDR